MRVRFLVFVFLSIICAQYGLAETDGTRILFTSSQAGTFDIWSCAPDGSDVRQITNLPGSEIEPRVSPNGQHIIYSSIQNEFVTLWIMDIDGSNQRQLITHVGLKATWAPDGDNILYCRNTGYWQATINQIDTNGNGDSVFKRPDAPYTWAAPHDWRCGHIVYLSTYSHSGTNRLHIMAEDASDAHRLIDYHSAWGRISNDCSKIVFAGNSQLRIANIDGTDDVLISGDYIANAMSFSPDDSQVAYASRGKLYVINSDGTDKREITTVSYVNSVHEWYGSNQPPTAIARDVDAIADDQCVATVLPQDVDDGSFDPDGDAITMMLNPEGPYLSGETAVDFVVTDDHGNFNVAQAIITVADHTEPLLSTISEPIVLWPPNHAYRTISVEDIVLSLEDNCDEGLTATDVVIARVESDEAENGSGDGNTLQDIVIAPDCRSVQLRAERTGNGNGRVYTVRLSLVDESGNAGSAQITVQVPHSKKETALRDAAEYEEIGNCI